MATKDYHQLALAVPCEYCGAKKGSPCIGSRGFPVVMTHHKRRAAAAQARREASR